jgi:hypothetical protein
MISMGCKIEPGMGGFRPMLDRGAKLAIARELRTEFSTGGVCLGGFNLKGNIVGG